MHCDYVGNTPVFPVGSRSAASEEAGMAETTVNDSSGNLVELFQPAART
jgi:hypothetical protein